MYFKNENGLQSKEIYQDEEVQYGVNYPRRHTILTENVPNNRASNYVRRKLIETQREREMNPLSQLETSIHLYGLDSSSRSKTRKDVTEHTTTISQLEIINVYRLFHPTTAECTFFSCTLEHSPKQTTFWAIKHTITNLKEQKSYNVCSQTIMNQTRNSITKR